MLKRDGEESSADREMMPPPKLAKKPTRKIGTSPQTGNAILSPKQSLQMCTVVEILQKAQTNECHHLKYFKALNDIYENMGHEKFEFHFLKGLRVWMKFDAKNVHANAGLKFCAKYLSSLANDVTMDTHPMLVSTFEFLLNRISMVANVRYRMCQFVNTLLSLMGSEVALEDYICRNITKYMLDRLSDLSAAVRVQAIKALQRLQLPNEPDDEIYQSYLFHLANDPSSAVRMAVVSAIERNFQTIPSIMERLWDIDENVRRHTFMEMSRYPVKTYRVMQRITFLERGLNDESKSVREMVTRVLLPQWLESYGSKYIAFVAALKIDSNEIELERFVKIAKQSLFSLFKNESIDKLIEPLSLTSEEYEFGICVSFEKLTVETAVYWAALIEYFQTKQTHSSDTDEDDQLQKCICDLSTFCDYLKKFYSLVDTFELKPNNQWIAKEHQYKARILVDILLALDLGDEIGRNKLTAFVVETMSTRMLEEEIVRKLVLAMENLIPESNERLQFFVDLVRSCTTDQSIDLSKNSIGSILSKIVNNPDLKIKITQLRLEILDLRERKMMANHGKDYQKVHDINEQLTTRNDDLLILLNEIDPESPMFTTKMTYESILQCLQICFYTVASKRTRTLTPNMCQLYKDFVRIQTESKNMCVRNWALKCDIAYSMLYEQLAKDAYNRLTHQFYQHHNACIWITSIKGIFELTDKYGFECFESDNESKAMEEQSNDDESKTLDIIRLFVHFLDTCVDTSIMRTLITGFCRLVLSGRVRNSNIVSKLMLTFFSPTCDPEINEILAIFFQALNKRKQHKCLALALLPTLHTILNAPIDSPLHGINLGEIIKFVVNSTMPADRNAAFNIHNVIALTFLNTMNEYRHKQDLMKLLSKELLTIQVSTDMSLRSEYQTKIENLLHHSLDAQVEKYIRKFQEIFADGKSMGPRTRHKKPMPMLKN